MTTDYFKYQGFTEGMFYGVPLTDEYLSTVSEQLWNYLLEHGAQSVLKYLGIGFAVTEREFAFFPELNEVVKKRMVYTSGSRKGKELSFREMENIGMFLKHGPYEHLVEKELNTNA